MTSRPSPLVAFVSLVALCGLALGCSGGSGSPSITGRPASTTTTSTTVPFAMTGADVYTPPDPLPAGAHGDLIWAEDVGEWWGSPRRAWRVLYLSEALDGRPIAVSGFVIAPPEDDDDDAAGRPVIAWSHETVGSADRCAPSKTFTERRPDDPVTRSRSSCWRWSTPARWWRPPTTRVWGRPAPTRSSSAPARAAACSTPCSPRGTSRRPGPATRSSSTAPRKEGTPRCGRPSSPRSGPRISTSSGWSRPRPSARWTSSCRRRPPSPEARATSCSARTGRPRRTRPCRSPTCSTPPAIERGALVEEACLIDVSLQLHQVALDTRRPIGRLEGFRGAAWSQQLASIKPGQEPIAAPVLVVQGVRDLIVPVQTTAVLTARLCDRGDVVHTVTYPGVGHSDVVIAADAEVRSWIGDRLAGTPATSDC